MSATGQSIREYVWLDDLPVAVLDGSVNQANPSLFFMHADHLGRPAFMSDAGRARVWEAHYEPFGAVHSITGPAANDNRFPGQVFQLESGLAYNWHRHYDANLGRYTQPDPLGLQTLLSDGPSVYGYARQSPLMNVDPTGEFVPVLVGLVGGLLLEGAADYLEGKCGCGKGSGSASYVSAGLSGALLGDNAFPVPYDRSGVKGASGSTSRTSSALSKLGLKSPVSIPAPTLNNPFARTANVGRALGRWAPIGAAGYGAYDLYRIARCLSQ